MDSKAFKSFLNRKNLRLTRQRVAVLNVIACEENQHLSALQIFEIVRKKNPKIGLATVYKNLRMLQQEGLLCKIELPDKTTHYEMNEADCIHCHLICVECGKIVEMKGSTVDNAVNLLKADSHFTLNEGSINFFGICDECAQSSAHAPLTKQKRT